MSTTANRAQEIFLTAIEQLQPDHWPWYLDEACAGNDPLRQAVEKLLHAHQELGTFHESVPATAQALPRVMEQKGTTIGAYKLLQQIGERGGRAYSTWPSRPNRFRGRWL